MALIENAAFLVSESSRNGPPPCLYLDHSIALSRPYRLCVKVDIKGGVIDKSNLSQTFLKNKTWGWGGLVTAFQANFKAPHDFVRNCSLWWMFRANILSNHKKLLIDFSVKNVVVTVTLLRFLSPFNATYCYLVRYSHKQVSWVSTGEKLLIK